MGPDLRKMDEAMDKASEPEIRIIPIPALPMGVAMAAMVVLSIRYDTFNAPPPAESIQRFPAIGRAEGFIAVFASGKRFPSER